MSPQERAALENPGKQFEMSAAEQASMVERIRKSKEVKIPSDLANPGKQFETLSPTEKKALEKVYGKFKKGGVVSASKRADGIAQRGKTRGKVL